MFNQEVSGLALARDESDKKVFAPQVVVPEFYDRFERGSARESSWHREPSEEGVTGVGGGRTGFVSLACPGCLRKCVDVDVLGEQQVHGKVLAVVEQSAQEVE